MDGPGSNIEIGGAVYGGGFISSSYLEYPIFLSVPAVSYGAIAIEYTIAETNVLSIDEMRSGYYFAHWTAHHASPPPQLTFNSTRPWDINQGSTPPSGSNLFPSVYISASTVQGSGGGTVRFHFYNNTFPPLRKYMTYTYRLLKRWEVS